MPLAIVSKSVAISASFLVAVRRLSGGESRGYRSRGSAKQPERIEAGRLCYLRRYTTVRTDFDGRRKDVQMGTCVEALNPICMGRGVHAKGGKGGVKCGEAQFALVADIDSQA